MSSLEARILEMLIRVRQFGLAHSNSFPTGSRGHELFDLIDGFIRSIEAHSTTQAQHARAAKEKTTQKKAAIRALREIMASIARTARGMTRNMPGLEDKFRLPSSERAQDILAAARACAADAEILKEEFIRRGMAPDFIEDLRARIGKVEESVDGKAQKSAARVSATVAVADAAQNARDAVRELNPVIRNVFAANPAKLAEWESASRVERTPRRAATEAPSSQPANTQS